MFGCSCDPDYACFVNCSFLEAYVFYHNDFSQREIRSPEYNSNVIPQFQRSLLSLSNLCTPTHFVCYKQTAVQWYLECRWQIEKIAGAGQALIFTANQ